MASTYSPKLRFELIGPGEQAGLWGNTTNKNIGQLIEQAIAGVTTVELDGVSGNYTLTALDGAPDQSRSAVVKCTYAAVPASGTVNIIIPAQTKLYVFRNDCGQTIIVKTAAQVTGVTLLNGEATLVFCDGTNAVAGIATAGVGPTTVANGGTGVTSFTGGFVKSPGGTGALTSSSTVNAATELSNQVPVANGGTGVSTTTAYGVLTGGTTSTGAFQNAGTGSSGQVLTSNGVGALPTWQSVGGVTSVSASSPLASTGGSTPTISLSGQVSVANGGTGANSFTSGGILRGNGSSALSVASASDIVSAIGATAVQNATSVSSITSFFTGSNQSLSTIGYQKFPGGFILQWGSTNVTGSQTTIFFATSFPTACWGITLARYKPGNTGGVNETAAIAALPTNSSILIGTSNVPGEAVNWIAVGY